ncbi:MAG TPA: alpha/beta fold hydrolase [Anaeromyxobacteraceae bacterium]|nr:alpha/beta fold hydrolase [Anaeromyxobacteraceae bacterium]
MGIVSTRLGKWTFDEHGTARHPGDPALVLLHGLMLDRRMWTAQIGALASLGRVLCFDGPGHGESEAAPPFTLEDHADALTEALDEVRTAKAILVGHSWGGMTALRFALRHRERLAGLAVVGTSADPEPWGRWLKYRVYAAWVSRLGVPRSLARLELARMVYGWRARQARRELTREFVATVRRHPREGLARAGVAVVDRAPIAVQMPLVAAPVLVLCGRDDRTQPLARSEDLARRIPGGRLVVLPGGHTPPVECPEEFNAALVPFLRRLLAARPEVRQAG